MNFFLTQFMNHSLQRSIAFSLAMEMFCVDGAQTTIYNTLSKAGTNHDEYNKCTMETNT